MIPTHEIYIIAFLFFHGFLLCTLNVWIPFNVYKFFMEPFIKDSYLSASLNDLVHSGHFSMFMV
ncbi:UNVERIFIED_CONTAM: hypothetical protein GTU68_054803 [Idotea baltica]|nr:hypothetical protein [Idotea baltica]